MSTEVLETDVVVPHLLSWCRDNRHKDCKRTYRRFHIDNRTNKVVWTNEVVQCSCKTRGCKCYVKPAERPKPVKKAAVRKRRKK